MRTGDRGAFCGATGALRILGRVDDVVNVRGVRVDARAVEAALGAAAAAGLRTRGRALLKRGAILKEGFGGFKRWSHRWLELELELDLTADGFRLAAVPEINRWFGGS